SPAPSLFISPPPAPPIPRSPYPTLFRSSEPLPVQVVSTALRHAETGVRPLRYDARYAPVRLVETRPRRLFPVRRRRVRSLSVSVRHLDPQTGLQRYADGDHAVGVGRTVRLRSRGVRHDRWADQKPSPRRLP